MAEARAALAAFVGVRAEDLVFAPNATSALNAVIRCLRLGLGDLGVPRLPGVPAPFMRAFELPPGDPEALWRRLYEEHRVEAPVYEREGRRVLRISIGPYNDEGTSTGSSRP
jgi:selenocysteine lyase/cysteine desulfurase